MTMQAYEGALPISVGRAAELCRVTPGTVRRWIRNGLPVLVEGRSGTGTGALVDACALFTWLRDQDGLEGARTRLAIAQAETQEMRNDERRTQLASVEAVRREWLALEERFRRRAISLEAIAPNLVGISDPARIATLLRDAVYKLLNELADDDG